MQRRLGTRPPIDATRQSFIDAAFGASWLCESEQLPDDDFVSLLVTRLESDLRVSDDAPGVSDVSRSAICIALPQLRIRSPKDRISQSESAREPASRVPIRVDRNGIDEQACVCISPVESLEMHHLLAAERSVPREETNCRAVAMLLTT